jgi:hypothetical protein
MPTTILNGFLYLGSYDTASRQELLKAMGITHILNVRSVYEGLAAYMCLCYTATAANLPLHPADCSHLPCAV